MFVPDYLYYFKKGMTFYLLKFLLNRLAIIVIVRIKVIMHIINLPWLCTTKRSTYYIKVINR